LKLVPRESLGAVSYSPSMVTMALSCIVCEIGLQQLIGRKSQDIYIAPVYSAPAGGGGDPVGIWRRRMILVIRTIALPCAETRSSAVAKRPRDALCLYRFYTLEWCGYPMVKKIQTYVYSF